MLSLAERLGQGDLSWRDYGTRLNLNSPALNRFVYFNPLTLHRCFIRSMDSLFKRFNDFETSLRFISSRQRLRCPRALRLGLFAAQRALFERIVTRDVPPKSIYADISANCW